MSGPHQGLGTNEISITGERLVRDGKAIRDSNEERIEWLIAHHLELVSHSREHGAWETLYRDPNDGRYWERTYPQSGMHGGGPPKLHNISSDQVLEKYGPVTGHS